MSLSVSLSSALSGIGVTARATQVVSDNIANAQTEGYGVRSLTQAARITGSTGSGVVGTGIRREVDAVLLTDLRSARTQQSGEAVRSDFLTRMEVELGLPDDADSLTALVDALEVSLSKATATPNSDILLRGVQQAASRIADRFSDLHATLGQQRDAADHAIAREIDTLNKNLRAIADLNTQIQRQSLTGGSPEALMDQRQNLVDQVSELVPVREIPREDGRIMLLGADGSILVDRAAQSFAFTRSPMPEAGDTIANGGVSAITLAGSDLSAQSPLFTSGRLGALLDQRDTLAPGIQAQIDVLARDLAERFMQPDIDPTLPAGAFGLFVLDGATGLPADPVGLAGQLRTNPAVDPASGGELWRLRNGLGLATQPAGQANDNALLDRMRAALAVPSPLASGSGSDRSMVGHVAETVSFVATQRLGLDQALASSGARVAALDEALAAKGVDTDAELSRLLVLEQAYAANARVLAAVDAMWRSLLEIR